MSDPLFYSCLLAFSVVTVFRSHLDKCIVMYHCAIGLHLSDGKWCWPSFHVLIWHFYPLQWNVSFSYFLPIFLIGLFLLWSFEISLHNLDTSPSFFGFRYVEKEMATHSSVLAWRIPGTGEPGGLPSTGLHRVGHDWSDLATAAAAACGELASFCCYTKLPQTCSVI